MPGKACLKRVIGRHLSKKNGERIMDVPLSGLLLRQRADM